MFSSSAENGFRARLFGRIRQPLQVVEPAREIAAALSPRIPLVTEVGKREFVVVQRRDRLTAHLLEKRRAGDRLDERGLLVARRLEPVPAAGFVEAGDAAGEERLAGLGRARLGVQIL